MADTFAGVLSFATCCRMLSSIDRRIFFSRMSSVFFNILSWVGWLDVHSWKVSKWVLWNLLFVAWLALGPSVFYLLGNQNPDCFDIDIKSDSKSCRLGNMVLLKAESEYCSGEQNVDCLCPSFPCLRTHFPNDHSIIIFRQARSCPHHRVQQTPMIHISALRCTPSQSTTQLGTL